MNTSLAVTIRATYKDTDQMGYVYYGNFFTWFEIARTEHFRSLGIVYRQLEDDGYYLPVHQAECQYKIPVTYDDVVAVETVIVKLGLCSVTFTYRITKDGKLAAFGRTVHCFTDKNGQPVKIPKNVRQKINVASV